MEPKDAEAQALSKYSGRDLTKSSMEWGSCQYDGSKEVFDLCVDTYKEAGLEGVEQLVNCDIGLDALPSEEELVKELAWQVLRQVREEAIDELKSWVVEEDYFSVQIFARFVGCQKVGDIFDAACESSWDLWGMAEFVGGPLRDVKVWVPRKEKSAGELDEIGKKSGEGMPVFNQMAAMESGNTGFICWFVHQFYGVAEDHFGGFDT